VIAHSVYNAWGKPQEEAYVDANFTGIEILSFASYSWDETLDLWYAQARLYDSESPRFIQQDPIKDGKNWYSYAENNPVSYVDPSGLAAYDPFSSLDDAAIDFAQEYYNITDYIMFEIGTLFYSFVDADGNTMYSYVLPIVGEPHSIGYGSLYGTEPDGSTIVATGHTHPNGTNFSGGDLTNAESRYTSRGIYASFVVVPGGSLLKYSTAGSVGSAGNTVWAQTTVSSYLQLKGLSIIQMMALYYTYGSKWNTHIGGAVCGFGCPDKAWPRTTRTNGIGQSWNFTQSDYLDNLFSGVLSKILK
jgi:RHS repeat-associated protein